MNPEFRRNFWLEATPVRMLVVSLGFLLLVSAVWTTTSSERGANTAFWIGFVALVFFGGYHAVSTISDEFEDRTWDWQRLSGQGAWSLLWGKIFGGGIMYWYLAVLGYIVLLTHRLLLAELNNYEMLLWTGVLLAAFGILSQSLAIAMSLSLAGTARLTAHGNPRTSRIASLAAVLIPTLVGFNYFSDLGFERYAEKRITWYGDDFHLIRFVTISTWSFAAWMVFAALRLLRAELQYHQIAWPWTALAIYLSLFALGFVPAQKLADNWFPSGLYMFALTGLPLTYLALLSSASSLIDLRQLFGLSDKSSGLARLRAVPGWLPLFTLVFLALIFMMFITIPGFRAEGLAGKILSDPDQQFTSSRFFLAVILFLVRDVLLVLFIRLNPKLKRPNLAPLGWLILLYWPTNWILIGTGAKRALGLFMPFDTGDWVLTLASPLLQCMIVAGLFFWRLRRQRQV